MSIEFQYILPLTSLRPEGDVRCRVRALRSMERAVSTFKPETVKEKEKERKKKGNVIKIGRAHV